jgi:hypothetical protein
MRQIEREMLRAIGANKAWAKDNTRVEPLTRYGITRVWLHENHIADCFTNCDGEIRAFTNRDTLAQWPTPTTKSRLRALGVDLTQKAGVISIDGEVVCHV